jgi:hypothetical protein
MILVLEWAKPFRSLDRAAIVIGWFKVILISLPQGF